MSEMGDMVIESISLAIDSYLTGTNTKDKVLNLSDAIRAKYFEVEDLTFDMLLKYQPVADDFRLIRSSTEISYAFSRFGRYAYDITLVRDLFGDVSECTNASLVESTNTRCALAEALLLRYLERIGDHAVFMSDAINYIVTGKHRPTEERIASHTKTEN